ncbi:hypothetical protein BJY04DRAFT_219847 [Aspergillus karnatakaensis]|uniref:uncharacterized protein n=1 Tax=Aspergillus karnatakaensis TaxID=1810916 RepID=UPI003CCD36F2
MATCKVSNRYIARGDLISLLDRLFSGQYTVSVSETHPEAVKPVANLRKEQSDAWIIFDIPRALTEDEIESISHH